MNVAESGTHPEARLGGSLRWIFVCALLIAGIPIVGAVLAIIAVTVAPESTLGAYMQGFVSVVSAYGLFGMAGLLILIIWAAVFAIMTLMRHRATPLISSIGLAVWVAFQSLGTLARLITIEMSSSRGNFPAGLTAYWPSIINIIASIAMCAAFCGYMATATRPNAYYLRRLPTS